MGTYRRSSIKTRTGASLSCLAAIAGLLTANRAVVGVGATSFPPAPPGVSMWEHYKHICEPGYFTAPDSDIACGEYGFFENSPDTWDLGARSQNTYGAIAADFDGDDVPDLFVGNANPTESPEILINNGTGYFARNNAAIGIEAQDYFIGSTVSGTWRPAVGDFDDDGNIDVFPCVFGENAILYNEGWSMSLETLPLSGNCRGAVAGNFRTGLGDDHGFVDIFVGMQGEGNKFLYSGKENRTMTEHDSNRRQPFIDPYQYTTIDVVGIRSKKGGHLDVFSVNWGERNILYINDGNGQFYDAQESDGLGDLVSSEHDQTYGAAVGDLNCDGQDDIFLGQYGPQLKAYLSQPDGSYLTSFVTMLDGTAYKDVATSSVHTIDVDGDGDLDILLMADNAGSSIIINTGDCSGTFVKANHFYSPVLHADVLNAVDKASFAVIEDFDGDGDMDAAVFQNFNLKNSLLLNRSGPYPVVPEMPPPPPPIHEPPPPPGDSTVTCVSDSDCPDAHECDFGNQQPPARRTVLFGGITSGTCVLIQVK